MTIKELIKALSVYSDDVEIMIEYAPNQCALVTDISGPTLVESKDLHSTDETIGKTAIYFSF